MSSKDYQADSFTLLKLVDDETRESIIQLIDKLKGLQTEVTDKLHKIDNDVADEKQKEQLLIFQQEIDKALNVITSVADMPIPEELMNEDFMKTKQKDLEKIKAVVDKSLQKLANFQE